MYSLISSGLITKRESPQPPEQHTTDKLTSVLAIYMDLLKTIYNYLEPILGPRTATTVASWRPASLTEQNRIFGKLHLNSPKATNIHYMREALEALDDERAACDLATESFNLYIKNILDQLPEILEEANRQALLKDIQHYLDRL